MKPTPLFSRIETGTQTYDNVNRATYKGIGIKTGILLLITILAALGVYLYVNYLALNIDTITAEQLIPLIVGLVVAAIVSLICGIIGRFSDRLAVGCSIIYSVAEGVMLGFITGIVDMAYPGLGVIAIFGTIIIFLIMLVLFLTGVIKAGNTFRAIFLGIILGIVSLSLFTIVYFFASGIMGTINDNIFIALVIGIEALLLLFGVISLTFNFMEAAQCVSSGASKASEWRVALGLEVSLIYIYIRLLRLLLFLAQFVNKK